MLQALTDALCEGCGQSLVYGFHADHRHPYAAGGPTDLTNAQALCPRCNLRKGARTESNPIRMESNTMDVESSLTGRGNNQSEFQEDAGGVDNTAPPTLAAIVPHPASPIPLRPWPITLRPWQREGVQTWNRIRNGGGKDITVTASPGSGKTDLALALARDEIESGRADLLVVVTPTRVLKGQWARSAHRAGLMLTADWGNGSVAPPPDVHGCCVTFGQVAALPEAFRLLCARKRVAAVMDEVHHCATSRVWGDALHAALEHAQARICLSGTAWRSDEAAIPFVTYGPGGVCRPDVTYDYAQALEDGVLRECFFFALGARVTWLAERGETEATFNDLLSERDRSRRLRAVLDADGDWLPEMLRQADAALSQARIDHPRAQGLAVAMDTAHARAIAEILRRETGEAPSVALSDDPASLSTLERFRTHEGRWLVVCRMAGEGYDCPNIRVVARATNLTGEASFRQVVARALRTVPGLERQDARVFLPADHRLIEMAQGLAGERGARRGLAPLSAADYADTEDGETNEGSREDGVSISRGLFMPLGSRATGRSVVTGGAVLPASALERARAMRASDPTLAGMPDHALAAELARMETEARREAESHSGTEVPPARDTPSAIGQEESVLGDEDDPGESGDYGGDSADAAEAQAYDPDQTYDNDQTYDQRRQDLRRICTRPSPASSTSTRLSFIGPSARPWGCASRRQPWTGWSSGSGCWRTSCAASGPGRTECRTIGLKAEEDPDRPFSHARCGEGKIKSRTKKRETMKEKMRDGTKERTDTMTAKDRITEQDTEEKLREGVQRAEAGLERAEWQLTTAKEAVRRAGEILRQAKVAEDAHKYRLSQAERLIAMYHEWKAAQERKAAQEERTDR